MTRSKTFLPQSTLEKHTELQTQDKHSSNPQALGTPHSPGVVPKHHVLGCSGWEARPCRSITADTSQEGTELFTGSHLLQGPAFSSPSTPATSLSHPTFHQKLICCPERQPKSSSRLEFETRDSQMLWLRQRCHNPF